MSDKTALDAEAAATLRSTVSEELGLAKHYEQLQNIHLTALFAVVGFLAVLRDRIGDLPGAGKCGLAALVLLASVLLTVAAIRACTLSILSFHAGMTCRNDMIDALRSGRPLAELLESSYRDPDLNSLPPVARLFFQDRRVLDARLIYITIGAAAFAALVALVLVFSASPQLSASSNGPVTIMVH
jgi:hypothetical protein